MASEETEESTICNSCNFTYYESIQHFLNNNRESLKFLAAHGVIYNTEETLLPNCPNCTRKLTFDQNNNLFKCWHSYTEKRNKRRVRCNFKISIYNGTFISGSHMSAFQVILFINAWLQKDFSHHIVIDNLKISPNTSVDWRSFCSEVTDNWFKKQKPIGGQQICVEIDETLITKRKYNRGRNLEQVWLFGGIERSSKKRFVVPLINDDYQPIPRNKENLLGLIKNIFFQEVLYFQIFGKHTTD